MRSQLGLIGAIPFFVQSGRENDMQAYPSEKENNENDVKSFSRKFEVDSSRCTRMIPVWSIIRYVPGLRKTPRHTYTDKVYLIQGTEGSEKTKSNTPRTHCQSLGVKAKIEPPHLYASNPSWKTKILISFSSTETGRWIFKAFVYKLTTVIMRFISCLSKGRESEKAAEGDAE